MIRNHLRRMRVSHHLRRRKDEIRALRQGLLQNLAYDAFHANFPNLPQLPGKDRVRLEDTEFKILTNFVGDNTPAGHRGPGAFRQPA